MAILKLLTLLSLMMFNFIHNVQTVEQTNLQVLAIGNADPCAAEQDVTNSTSDNLSCIIGETRCFNRSELCNGNPFCLFHTDEGGTFPTRYQLDCKL